MRAQREAAAMVMAKGEPPLLLAGWLAMAMAVKLPRTSAADKVQRSPSAEAQGIWMTFIPHVDRFDGNHPTRGQVR